MKHLTLIPLVLCFICATAQEHFKIYSTSKQKMASTDEIINAMRHADVLFFGEEHDDSIAHARANPFNQTI